MRKCSSADRLFFNGYQTWTVSHEVRPSDSFPAINPFFRTLGSPFGTRKYGDEFFIRYSGKQGCFHGFSYMYRRRGDVYTLVASTDETNGYTIFYYDAVTGEALVLSYPWFAERCIEIFDLFVDPGNAHVCLYDLFINTAVIPRSSAAVPEYSERDQQSYAAHDEPAY